MRILLWKKRTEKGYSVRKLSELSGISKSSINNIENNKVSPTIKTVEILAKALDCNFIDLLEFDE